MSDMWFLQEEQNHYRDYVTGQNSLATKWPNNKDSSRDVPSITSDNGAVLLHINIVCSTRASQLLGLMLLGLRKILAVYRHDSVLNRIGNKILTIYVRDVTIYVKYVISSVRIKSLKDMSRVGRYDQGYKWFSNTRDFFLRSKSLRLADCFKDESSSP